MSIKKTLGALILAGSLACGGCAANKDLSSSITPQPTVEYAVEQQRNPKIKYIVEQQKKGVSYGDNLSHLMNIYDDGFNLFSFDDGVKVDEHVFGTRICADKIGLAYISVFADNIFVEDIAGDGVDGGEIFANHYDLVKGNRGNPIIKKIPVESERSNVSANKFQNAVLDVIVEKYKTGKVSQGTINAYERAKNSLLDSLK